MNDENPRPEDENPLDGAAATGLERPETDRKISAGVMSHEGKTRPFNEDSVIAVDLKAGQGKDTEMRLYAIADGAGGMAAGKVASNLTVRAVKHSVAGSVADAPSNLPADAEHDPYAEWLQAAVRAANYLVHLQSQQEQARMASTLVMALIEGEHVHIANVGDSRAYVVDKFGLRQITEDHSAVQELLRAGLIENHEVEGHPFEHVLTRAIGPEEEVEPDLYTERVHAGDRLLLCSDGLTNMVSEEEIWQIVYNAPDPQIATQELIDAANRAGGKDNITAVVVEVRP